MSEQPPVRHKRLARAIIWVVIVSFSLAAIAGIAVLLGAEMNETSAKVLLTTVIVGGFGLAALSGLGLLGRRLAWFGLVTIGVAVVGMLYTLWFVWSEAFEHSWERSWHAWEWLGTAVTLAVFCSAAARLLTLVDRKNTIVRVGMAIALVLLAFSSLIVLNLIWDITNASEQNFRLYGIVWILTALAVIVTPILAVVLKAKPAELDAAVVPPAPPAVLSPDSVGRIVNAAVRRGVTPDALVAELLDGMGELGGE